MKFTPLDIQRRDFEKSFRGFEEGEVRGFLHEIAADWEEILVENSRMREEILNLRERNRQYQDQDRIFRETLLQAQRTKEDVLDTANREKDLTLKEAQFKADEIIREAHQHVAELEMQMRNMKMERIRMLEDMESLMERTRRFLQEEAPERFPPSSNTVKLDDMDFNSMEEDVPLKPRGKRF